MLHISFLRVFHYAETSSREARGTEEQGTLLYVSGIEAATNLIELRRCGITHVVNLVAFEKEKREPFLESGISYLSLALRDRPQQHIPDSLLLHVIAFIEKARRATFVALNEDAISGAPYAPQRVLIHCHQGVSRSITFVVAYIMWCSRWSYRRAFELVKSRRSIANPNVGFAAQLMRWVQRAGIVSSIPQGTTRHGDGYTSCPNQALDLSSSTSAGAIAVAGSAAVTADTGVGHGLALTTSITATMTMSVQGDAAIGHSRTPNMDTLAPTIISSDIPNLLNRKITLTIYRLSHMRCLECGAIGGIGLRVCERTEEVGERRWRVLDRRGVFVLVVPSRQGPPMGMDKRSKEVVRYDPSVPVIYIWKGDQAREPYASTAIEAARRDISLLLNLGVYSSSVDSLVETGIRKRKREEGEKEANLSIKKSTPSEVSRPNAYITGGSDDRISKEPAPTGGSIILVSPMPLQGGKVECDFLDVLRDGAIELPPDKGDRPTASDRYDGEFEMPLGVAEQDRTYVLDGEHSSIEEIQPPPLRREGPAEERETSAALARPDQSKQEQPRLYKCLEDDVNSAQLSSRLSGLPTDHEVQAIFATVLDWYGDYDDEDLTHNSNHVFALFVPLCTEGQENGPRLYMWIGQGYLETTMQGDKSKGVSVGQYGHELLRLLLLERGAEAIEDGDVVLEHEGAESSAFWDHFELGF